MDDISSLRSEFESAMDALVESGRYPSREDVLREGVRLVQDREARLARFEAKIAKSIASADRGDVVDLDVAFDQVRASIRSVADGRAA